jgi:hypothetical protein
MFLRRIIFSLLLLTGLTGCGSVESEVQEAVRKSLKDPESAKFGKFTLVNENGACIWVNARNSQGGYSGEQIAVVVRVAKTWHVIGINSDFDLENCKRIVSASAKENN